MVVLKPQSIFTRSLKKGNMCIKGYIAKIREIIKLQYLHATSMHKPFLLICQVSVRYVLMWGEACFTNQRGNHDGTWRFG